MTKDKQRIRELEQEVANLKAEKRKLIEENQALKSLVGTVGSYATVYGNMGVWFNGYPGFTYQTSDDSKTPTESELP